MKHHAVSCHLTPIAILPFELLMVIFRFGVEEEFGNSLAVPSNPFQRPIPFARRVSQVCRAWHEISRSIPSLWSFMPYYESYGAHWIDGFLELSQNSLLDIKLSAGLRSRNFPPSNISALYNHIHRIRTLFGTTHSSAPPSDIQKLLEGPMPNLQTLILCYGFGVWDFGDSSMAAFPEILLAGAPSLTTFISFRCFADLSSPAFSRLQALEIHDIPPPFSPTVSQWLESLRNMPFLQKLSITQSTGIDDDSSEMVIDMPCLSVVRFTGDFTIFTLLGQLLTPQLAELDLSLTCGRPVHVFMSEGLIQYGFRRSLQNWGAWLAERTLGIRLTDDRLIIHTLSSPQFRTAKKHAQLLVELKWTLNDTIPHDVGIIINSIGEIIQPVQSLATRIDISTSLNHDTSSLNPIPSHLSESLRRLFGRLSHVRHWMGYSIKDVYALSSLLLGEANSSSEASPVFPLLDTFSLRNGPSVWHTSWVKAFISGRSRLGTPIQAFRVSAKDRLNLDGDFGCRIETDDQSLDVFIEQDEIKHVSTEL